MQDPIKALGVKREADRLFYVNAALFSPSFRRTYSEWNGGRPGTVVLI